MRTSNNRNEIKVGPISNTIFEFLHREFINTTQT